MTFTLAAPNVTQTGADTLNYARAAPAGMTKTSRGQVSVFSTRTNNLIVNGALTIDATSALLQNTVGNTKITINNNGSLTITGQKTTAANAPYGTVGVDWACTTDYVFYINLAGTANDATKPLLIVRDAAVRFGIGYMGVATGKFGTIQTEGTVAYLLNNSTTGSAPGRIRSESSASSFNFTAGKTYCGIWLNIGVPATSLKGYTPLNTDGPEINADAQTIAQKITIEDYDTRYVVGTSYTGCQIVLYGKHWCRLKNNLLGTNIIWLSKIGKNGVATVYNVIEFSKGISATITDTDGVAINSGNFYYQPVGSNVAAIRSKGGTADITFPLANTVIPISAGSASTEFCFAWDYTSADNYYGSTGYKYFCTTKTRGSESHDFWVSVYGYAKQKLTIVLSGNGNATPVYKLTALPTSDKVLANGGAVTGVSLNGASKTVTVTGNQTVQKVYDYYQWWLNQTAQLYTLDDGWTYSNGILGLSTWKLVVNAGITLTGNVNTSQTITINATGKIDGSYTDSTGSTYKFTISGVVTDSEVRCYTGTNPATSVEIAGTESSSGDFIFYQKVAGQAGYIQIHHVDYQMVRIPITWPASPTSLPVQQIKDRQYNRGTVYAPS